MTRLTAVVLLLAVSASAQLSVPGDFPDPQSAIAAAAPGAVIVVHGGQWSPIVIDKPLTIIGDPQPLFTPGGDPPFAQSPVTLAGPGSGVVRLVNVWLGGGITAEAFSACGASISGGGFDALHVCESRIEGAPWQFAYNTVFPGADAIHVDVPFLLLQNSSVRGADAAAGTNSTHSQAVDAGDAIVTTGEVLLLDSEVRGGDGPKASWDAGGMGGGPPVCPGGAGGDAVVCVKLAQAASPMLQGSGMQWYDEDGVLPICTGPSGTLLTAGEVINHHNILFLWGPFHLGGPAQAIWNAPPPAAVLFISAGVGPAGQLGSPRLHLLPPLYFGGLVDYQTGLNSTVPGDSVLLGVEIGMQLYTTAGWSRPVVSVIGP